MGYEISRRAALLGISAVTVGIGTKALAQEDPPLAFFEIERIEEYVVIENVTNESYDLTGHEINFEVGQEVNQIQPFPDGTTVAAGERLKIATGAEDVPDADVDMGYEGEVINNDETDVIGILNPNGELIIRSDNDDHWVSDVGEDVPDDEEPVDDDEEEEDEEPVEEEEEEEADEEDDDEDLALPTEFEAELTGEAHGIETNASGRAHFEVEEHEDYVDVHYELVMDCIRDATMAHIHLGGPDEDGPVVVWLYPEEGQEPELVEGVFKGTLAEGTFTADDFVGPFEGLTVEKAHAEVEDQGAYVNVHTEQHPGGEIRGQIEPVNGN